MKDVRLKNNRQKIKLEDVADVKLSNVDKKNNPNERIIRLCNYTDVYNNTFIAEETAKKFMVATANDNEIERFRIKKGQVAITKDSETPDDIGVSTYISCDFDDVLLGYHLALITPFAKALSGQYLNYLFHTKHLRQYCEYYAGGSGQRCSLALDSLKSIPLNELPDFDSQCHIATVLSSLDEKIALNNRINDNLPKPDRSLTLEEASRVMRQGNCFPFDLWIFVHLSLKTMG